MSSLLPFPPIWLGKIQRAEVEHLFDAHYSVSRPRLRVIRVCGGVRGRGRWVTSPGAFTLLFAVPVPPSLLPAWLLSAFLLVSFSPSASRKSSPLPPTLPTTCEEGDGAASDSVHSESATLLVLCIRRASTAPRRRPPSSSSSRPSHFCCW